MSSYIFSESTQAFTSITGGTQLVTTTAGATSFDTDGSFISLPVASQFSFNGTTITSVNMTSDGSLWLNPGSSTIGNGTTVPISSTASAIGIIAALAMDLISTSINSQVYERRWQDDGTDVVFQWLNAARYFQAASERFSFQIRITKSSGVVSIVYGNMTTITTALSSPQVGLRGSTNSDFNVRRLTTSVPDSSPNWGAPNGTTSGTSNAHNCRFINTCIPSSGLTFIWTPPTPCSGTPNPGNTLATANTIISGGITNLSLQNSTGGAGVSYQWFYSTTSSSGPWTSITNATGSTYTASPTAASTWYYCSVTCGLNTSNSTPVQIFIYCTTLYTTGCGTGADFIDNVVISNGGTTVFSHLNTGCNSGSTSSINFTGLTMNLTQGTSYTYTITNGAYNEYIGIWIDFNDNGVFSDAGEFLGGNTTTTASTYNITGTISIPSNASIGNHRMRIRLTTSNVQSLTTSCTSYSFGETHDYTVNIAASNSPNITVSGTLSPLSACFGTASSSTTFNVSGSNLSDNITVNAPTGFEVSLSSNTGYSSSVTLTQNNGSVSSVPVYFRIATSASVGTLSGNITLTSTGASTVTIAINGTVNALPSAVTVSPATSTIVPPATTSLTASGGTISSTVSTATIGTDNSSTKIGSNGNPYKCGTTNNGARNQWIILASELTAAGLQAGSQLSSLTFYVTTSYGGTINNQTFGIAHTSASSFTSTSFLTETFTTVYSNTANYSPVSGDVHTHSFSTNFVWNGTSNIVIEDCHNIVTAGADNQSPDLQTFTTSFYSSIGYSNVGGISGTCTVATGTRVLLRPVMLFNIDPVISPTWTWSPNTSDNTSVVTVGPTSTTTYTATATINGCSTSNTAVVNVNSNTPGCPNAASVSASTTQTVCQNGTTTQLTASYTTTGTTGTPTVQYQWYYNTTNSNTIAGATLISGETLSTYTPPASTIGSRYYFCVVYATDNGCNQTNATQSLASNTVQVTIVDPATLYNASDFGTVASVPGASTVNHLVISQVYGAGSNDYRYDFVELFNPTSATINIEGYTLQYQTAGQSSWSIAATFPLNTNIPAGKYFLIHLDDQVTGASIIADYTGTTVVNANQAKMALSNTSAQLTSCTSSTIVDKVAWGTTSVVCNETSNAPSPGNSASIFRKQNGCQDTDNNSSDFNTAFPNPRNSASPANLCVVSTPTTFCGSGTPGAMSVTGVAGGSSYSYQWYSKTGLVSCPTGTSTSGWTLIPGANAATYTPSSAISSSTTYACMVTINGAICSYTQWATSCVQITINPNPSIADKTAVICSGNNYTLAASVGDVIPSGTTYTWTFTDNTNVTGESNGTAQSPFSQTISSSSTATESVVYNVNSTNGTCTGNPFSVTLTIPKNPSVIFLSPP